MLEEKLKNQQLMYEILVLKKEIDTLMLKETEQKAKCVDQPPVTTASSHLNAGILNKKVAFG
jgi:hypothetical protein